MIIYLKRLKSSKFVRVKAFPMYGGIGVSAPSLHRESTDSLIPAVEVHVCTCTCMYLQLKAVYWPPVETVAVTVGYLVDW